MQILKINVMQILKNNIMQILSTYINYTKVDNFCLILKKCIYIIYNNNKHRFRWGVLCLL